MNRCLTMVGQRHQRARFEGFRFEQKIVRRGDREEVGITSAGGFGDRRSSADDVWNSERPKPGTWVLMVR
jgi:hypothetical protein